MALAILMQIFLFITEEMPLEGIFNIYVLTQKTPRNEILHIYILNKKLYIIYTIFNKVTILYEENELVSTNSIIQC